MTRKISISISISIAIILILAVAVGAGVWWYGEKNSPKCELKPDTGYCEARFIKYYFDQEDNICKNFIWGGCEGLVPFDTLDECQKNCESVLDLSNWQTYRNEEYGFEFKYLKDWKINNTTNQNFSERRYRIGENIIFIDIIPLDKNEIISCEEGYNTRCNVVKINNGKAVIQYNMDGSIIAQVNSDNKYLIDLKLSCDDIKEGMVGESGYCIINDLKLDTFNQILSTFRFIP